MRIAIALSVLLSACASAPQVFCIPPQFTREPEGAGTPMGAVMPQDRLRADEEYQRCLEEAEDVRLDAWLREEEARAKKREAEKLALELEEMKKQEAMDSQAPGK